MLISSVDITAQHRLPECLSAGAAWVPEQQTISRIGLSSHVTSFRIKMTFRRHELPSPLAWWFPVTVFVQELHIEELYYID